MIHRFIFQQIRNVFPYEPTDEQRRAIDRLSHFLSSPVSDDVFLLKGYAGTGKTSLLGATVKALTALRRSVVLLAPTGRAAKVFSEYAGRNALTIHRKIYRQKTFSNEFTGFSLAPNLHQDTLFIIDEASMISNDDAGMASFGSGRLLDDLIRYVYNGKGCKLILLGDGAQLPPVLQSGTAAQSPIANPFGNEAC